jgi:hypothetical protein
MTWSPTLKRLPVLLGLAVALAAAPPTVAGHATGAARNCPASTFVRGRLAAVATVLSVRNIGCRQALGVVRRNGRGVGADAYRVGGRFALGSFGCRVYYVVEEAHRARCADASKAFRVDYGS